MDARRLRSNLLDIWTDGGQWMLKGGGNRRNTMDIQYREMMEMPNSVIIDMLKGYGRVENEIGTVAKLARKQ